MKSWTIGIASGLAAFLVAQNLSAVIHDKIQAPRTSVVGGLLEGDTHTVRIQLWDEVTIECNGFSFVPPYQQPEGSPLDIPGAGSIVVWFENSKLVPPTLQIARASDNSPTGLDVVRSQVCRQESKLS